MQSQTIVSSLGVINVKRRTRLVLIGVSFAFLGVIGFLCVGVWESLQAEETHHSQLVVLKVLRTHLDESGKWPNSWEELASTQIEESRQHSMLRWPDAADEIRERIKIDFTYKAEDIAKMRPQDFPAVVPIGPNYGPCEAEIDSVIWAAKRVLKRRSKKGADRPLKRHQ